MTAPAAAPPATARPDAVGARRLDWRLARRLWPFVRPYRRAFGAALAILVASFGIELLGPHLIRLTIDGPIRDAIGGADVGLERILVLGLAYFGSSLAGVALAYGYALLTARNGQRVVRDLRVRVFDHLMQLSPTYHDRHPSGKLTTRITSDLENLNELIATGVLQSLFDLLKIVGILGVLLWIDPLLALYTIAVTPVVVLISLAFRRRARSAYRAVRGRLASQNAFTAEVVDGTATIRAFGQADAVGARYGELNRSTRDAWLSTVLAFSLFFALVDLALRWSQAGLLMVGGLRILDGTITAGIFVQFWLYFGKLTEPIRELGEKYNVLQSALASTERIFAILDETPAPVPAAAPAPVPRGPVRITFESVTFGYDPKEPVLRGIDLEIPAGSTCAIVGPTGAGKTSLVALVSRLYDPQQGRVAWNGTPLTELDLRELRRRVGVAPQDVFLFTGSVLDNVRLFDEDVTEAAVRDALCSVGALEIVEAMPDGLATRLDERGATLSHGERQLLSFARAVVSDPDVLVLDEATASIDSRSEARIERALESLLRGRTCLIVAHRLSTVRGADQIVVLEGGRVAERGDHQSLLARAGTYARMVRAASAPG